jgi:integrase
VKDVEFTLGEIVVRDGKGAKDRMTMLPRKLAPRLRNHLDEVHLLHHQDLADGLGATWLPAALQRKYPGAACDWGWQYVFPSRGISRDPRSGVIRRHHVSDQAFQRAMRSGGARRRHRQTGHAAHAAAFIRDAFAGIRLRHPHLRSCSGIRTSGRR